METWSDSTTHLSEIRHFLRQFRADRDWDRFHRPKDLAIAVSVEAGELLELFLWTETGEVGARAGAPPDRLEQEAADVAICLLNFCNRMEIDLARAIARKMDLNAEKYPIEKARGTAAKYNEVSKT